MAATLLRQNSELARLRVWNWTLPAGPVTLPDGRRVNVCPNADACLALCYARKNAYIFRDVRAAHLRNLARILDDLNGWIVEMIAELDHPRHRFNGRTRLDLLDVDRHAEVFATSTDLDDASYVDQEESDLLAVLHRETRIGIVSNNIPQIRTRMAGQSFGEIQRARTERRIEIKARRSGAPS